MDAETTDELVGLERHALVSLAALDAVVLPLEANALLIEGAPEARLLDATPGLKYKAASVAYGAGLRAAEVVSTTGSLRGS